MGRLLNPGLGELMDRMSILTLKISRAPSGTSTTHFRDEHAQLRHRVDHITIGTPLQQSADLAHELEELLKANTKLWDLEDHMAFQAQVDPSLRAEPGVIANLGMAIWQTNRYRNALIAKINRLAGTERGDEKFY
jgi:hypothetical protein